MRYSDWADRKAWQVLEGGSAIAAADWIHHPFDWYIDDCGYYFGTREAAEKCVARKIAEGWDATSIEIAEVDYPPPPPPKAPPTPSFAVGRRGGTYTNEVTKGGRPYRRYL